MFHYNVICYIDFFNNFINKILSKNNKIFYIKSQISLKIEVLMIKT